MELHIVNDKPGTPTFNVRPYCERLINMRLNDLRLNIMRELKVALEKYIKDYYDN
jgi:hypothetical protein